MAMISETGSTRLRDPENRKIRKSNKDVFVDVDSRLSDLAPFAYEFRHDDDIWVVLDKETGIFGHGEDPLDALRDFDLAAAQHLDVLEQEPALSEELSRQLEYLRARIQR